MAETKAVPVLRQDIKENQWKIGKSFIGDLFGSKDRSQEKMSVRILMLPSSQTLFRGRKKKKKKRHLQMTIIY